MKVGYMNRDAIGVIETIGMAAAIEAADTAVKSANVRLIGYELTRGQGMVTIKIAGDVGAVKAAISAARRSAEAVNRVVSTLLIPRPAGSLEMIIESSDTVGLENNNDVDNECSKDDKAIQEVKEETEINLCQEVKLESDNKEANDVEEAGEDKSESKKEYYMQDDIKDDTQEEIEDDTQDDNKDTDDGNNEICNLCFDINCPRRKGQSKNLCIHYKEKQGE